MRRPAFDLDALRSFVLGVELNNFARASAQLARSTSAVSAHLKKLERQTGAPLVRKSGRGTVLTETGEILLGYARRLLELNDEATSALRTTRLEGRVRLGVPEDFGENLLPVVLGRFARAHPKVRIEACIGRVVDLRERIANGKLDLALIWSDGTVQPHGKRLIEVPLCWIGPTAGRLPLWSANEPLPLIALEAPCLVRSLATAALDRAGIPWRLTFTSTSLSASWAATTAGLGLTARTQIGLPESLRALAPGAQGLPLLPSLELVLVRAEAKPSSATEQLASILHEHLVVHLDTSAPQRQRNAYAA